MANIVNYSEEEIKKIKEYISQNINPNKISKLLEHEFEKNFNYHTIKSKILTFNKKWDAKNKVYIDISDEESKKAPSSDTDLNKIDNNSNENSSNNVEENISNSHLDENMNSEFQLSLFDSLIEQTDTYENINEDSYKTDDEKAQHVNPNSDISEVIINHLLTINKNIESLHQKIKQVEKTLSTIVKDNSYEKLDILADELIAIYASEKSKKSVNINSKILNKTIKLMKDKLNIKNNKSLAINTALLITLYRSNLDKIEDINTTSQ